jgi:endonuclease YncB( thermonuclease family)
MRRIAFVGRRVWLRTDSTQDVFDRYGRLLAYVDARSGGEDLGRRMLRAGWAKVYVDRLLARARHPRHHRVERAVG